MRIAVSPSLEVPTRRFVVRRRVPSRLLEDPPPGAATQILD
jgi:hypothetical protein